MSAHLPRRSVTWPARRSSHACGSARPLGGTRDRREPAMRRPRRASIAACGNRSSGAVAPDASAGVVALPFAFPLLIVTGGRAPATVPGVLADVGRVREVLEASGVLGQARNFGLAQRAVLPRRAGVAAAEPAACARPARSRRACWTCHPPEIAVTTSDEQVHLRFLLGAVLDAGPRPELSGDRLGHRDVGDGAHARAVASSCGWRGSRCCPFRVRRSRCCARRRAGPARPRGAGLPGLRQPCAAAVPGRGRRAGRDGRGAGQRRNRCALRPPACVEDRVDVHAWALHPLDDLEEVAGSILGLLAECRLHNFRVLPEVVVGGGLRAEDSAGAGVDGGARRNARAIRRGRAAPRGTVAGGSFP